MKTYYLVARKEGNDNQRVCVFVTDNSRGYQVLIEFRAENFDDAQKKFSFQKNIGNGDLKII